MRAIRRRAGGRDLERGGCPLQRQSGSGQLRSRAAEPGADLSPAGVVRMSGGPCAARQRSRFRASARCACSMPEVNAGMTAASEYQYRDRSPAMTAASKTLVERSFEQMFSQRALDKVGQILAPDPDLTVMMEALVTEDSLEVARVTA
jgi:hypothetical protein